MRMDSAPELLSFAVQVLEKHGAIAEQHDNHVMALLPSDLARTLDLPEEVQLGESGVPLLYGSPALDRLIDASPGDGSGRGPDVLHGADMSVRGVG